MASNLVTKQSPHSFEGTLDRLEQAIRAGGATLFARVDHAAAAASVGLSLRPTTVLLFGNPQAGTPLMQGSQTFGLDLPLRVLVWQDASGQVWLTYRHPAAMAGDHVVAESEPRVVALDGVLAKVTDQAVAIIAAGR
jgi:uncharacterized protein (DUF302 family)